ncbi:MAG: DUF2809 domain-containing protein [Chloroflexaceae bacterium]|nr:DUF2809 domain-containing protein [Chloroflexaceae bacterium]
MHPNLIKLRWLVFFSLLLVVPLGLFSKTYNGPGDRWLNHFGGGVIYEIFWCLFFFGLFPGKKSISLIPLWVFAITALLELLQLWQPPFLQTLRATWLGRTLLGTTFSAWDFPHYLLGCAIASLWLRLIWQTAGSRDRPR